jgi:2-amino-4-hydroxy-6-hydroxymethyldihydropteridine diphosphokinase
MALAYVALGANLGDAKASLQLAISKLADLAKRTNGQLIGQSKLYVTQPWQAQGPDFTNAVVAMTTNLAPQDLLKELQAIEVSFGRERPYKNAPRTLDLDILLIDDLIIQSATLTVPHPRMHERRFVLEPLLDIAPDLIIPNLGSVRNCLSKIAP